MKRRTLLSAGISLALVACGGGSGGGDPPPPNPGPPTCSTGISTPRAFPNLSFSSPVAMKQAPNDASRWFLVEQGGRILAFENDPDAATTEDFIDLRSRVEFNGEAGLLGMAFHPDFATNGLVYLNFSELVGGDLRSVTAEFASTDGGQTLNPASERVLMTVDKPATNHNGGNIAFGPDGFLYIGLGDGGGAGDPNGNGQNPRRLLGKMLRIDVDSRPGGAPYGIPGGPGGNPFSANPLCNVGRHRRRRNAPRSLRSDSAIPGAGALTARRTTSGSATSASPRSRRSTSSCSAATMAGIRAKAPIASSRQAAARPRA